MRRWAVVVVVVVGVCVCEPRYEEPYEACEVRREVTLALRARNRLLCGRRELLKKKKKIRRGSWHGGICSSFNVMVQEWASEECELRLETLALPYKSAYGYFTDWCPSQSWNCLYEPVCERRQAAAPPAAGPPAAGVARANHSPIAYFDWVAAVVSELFGSLRPVLGRSVAAAFEVLSSALPQGTAAVPRVVALHVRRGDKRTEGYRNQSAADIARQVADARGGVVLALSDSPEELSRIGAELSAISDARFVDLSPLVRADGTGAAVPFVAALHVLATADHLVANFGSNVARFLLPLMTNRNVSACRTAWGHAGGYPNFTDLDGLVRPEDVLDGYWWTFPATVIYNDDASIAVAREMRRMNRSSHSYPPPHAHRRPHPPHSIVPQVRSTFAGTAEMRRRCDCGSTTTTRS